MDFWTPYDSQIAIYHRSVWDALNKQTASHQESKTMKTIATLGPVDVSVTNQIPKQILESINLYTTEGRPTGDFLRAVLTNDLMMAVRLADNQSLNSILAICRYVHTAIPANSHGSLEAYRNHLAKACF